MRGRSVVLPIIHKNLVQGHRITRVLSALKIPMSTYSDWIHWEPSAQEIQHNKLRIAVESNYQPIKAFMVIDELLKPCATYSN
ncbi:hypothetical protein [Weissella sp. LMG 11983]|uniref:hypothetical protein n=1 Tax=Weissella sp. LMG 11983 TaxID=2987700 RepID=UPI0021F818CF|nr:hypothetical protein [Weissella sp. LMG 11983]MCW0925876.1 hypothetical protein [Weissella sp. LMG 11983]